MWKRSFVALVMSLVAAPCFSQVPIRVRVTDATGRQLPLAAASVLESVENRQVERAVLVDTTPAGHTAHVPATARFLVVRIPGFTRRVIALERPLQTGEAVVVVKPVRAVRGTLVDRATNQPLEGVVQARVQHREELELSTSRASQRGLFELSLPDDVTQLTAWADGYAPHTIPIGADRGRVVLALEQRSASVRGVVVDNADVPLPGVTVVLTPMEPKPDFVVRSASDVDGSFHLRSVAPEVTYRVALDGSSCRGMVVGTLRLLAGEAREGWVIRAASCGQ